jgi:hypothetical protein
LDSAETAATLGGYLLLSIGTAGAITSAAQQVWLNDDAE